jgi:uncharacterized protein YukE
VATSTDRDALIGELGLPKDDPTEFPEHDAATVMDWAVKIDAYVAIGGAVVEAVVPAGGTFVDMVSTTINLLKDLLGDPELAGNAALGWAEAATVPLALKQELNNQLIQLNYYWEGPAHVAFAEHISAVLAAMDTTSTKLLNVGKKVAEAYSLVFETWESGLKYLNDCAANLIGLAALPFSITDAGSFLKGFVDAITTLYESMLTIMIGYQQDILDLAVETTTFPALPGDADVLALAGDTSDWDVTPN